MNGSLYIEHVTFLDLDCIAGCQKDEKNRNQDGFVHFIKCFEDNNLPDELLEAYSAGNDKMKPCN